MLDVAFPECKMTRKVKASASDVSERSVGRFDYAVAQSLLMRQDFLCRSLAEHFAALHVGEMSFVSSFAFDDTEQKLAIKLTESTAERGFVWKVLVSSQCISYCHSNAAIGEIQEQSRRLLRPCVVLLNGKAETAFGALFNSNPIASIDEVERKVASSSFVCCFHIDRDACATNDKIVHGRNSRLLAGRCVLASDMSCGNHRTACVDTSILVELDVKLTLCVAYRVALLMRMGNYFLRCACAVPFVLRESAIVRPRAEHRGVCDKFNLELVDYLKSNYDAPSSASKMRNNMEIELPLPQGKRTSRQSDHRFAKLDALCDMFPLPWYNDPVAFTDNICDAAAVVKGVLYKSLVLVPSQGKWNASGPALDSILTQQLFSGFFTKILNFEFKDTAMQKRSIKDAAMHGLETSLLEDIFFHEVANRLLKDTMAWGNRADHKQILLFWALAKELQRMLHKVFMHGASDHGRRETAQPPLCDLVRAKFSPVRAALQHYAALLTTTTAPRLTLITESATMPAWKHMNAGLAVLLRRVLLTASTWTRRRHQFLEEDPWTFATMADRRVSSQEKERYVESLATKPRCQLDPMFTRIIVSSVPGDAANVVRVLLAKKWQRFSCQCACRVHGSNCTTECKHAWNKANSTRDTSWLRFSALFLNHDAVMISEALEQHRAEIVTKSKGETQLTPTCDNREIAVEGFKNALSALGRFRKEVIAIDHQMLLVDNICSVRHWDRVKNEFAKLEDDKRAIYVERSNAGKHEASCARANKRRHGEVPTVEPILACADLVQETSSTHRDMASQIVIRQPTDGYDMIAYPLMDAGAAPSTATFLQDDVAPTCPLTPASLRGCIAQAVGVRGLVRQFKTSLAKPAPASARLPRSTASCKKCSSVCMHQSSFALVNLRDALVEWARGESVRLARLTTCDAKERNDSLYGFDLRKPSNDIFWVMMSSSIGRSGATGATQNFAWHVPAEGHVTSTTSAAWQNGQGFRLVLKQDEFVEVDHVVAKTSPFKHATVGAVSSSSELDMANDFVRQQTFTTSMSCNKFRWVLDELCPTLSGIRTVGLDKEFPPCELKPHSPVLVAVNALVDLLDDEYVDYMRDVHGETNDIPCDDAKEDLLSHELVAMMSAADRDEIQNTISELQSDYRRAIASSIGRIDKVALCRLLQIELTPQWKIMDLSGSAATCIGQIRAIRGELMQMTCCIPRHRCKLILKCDKHFFSCELDMVKWLCEGFACTPETHYAKSEPLREMYNRKR
eukprot:TRINITY_DN34200_c0_g1_i1.p1 TRINITY_DN34200_c0_g1~~TRINITY_DN34200_c0_g1_i1.p1  ORF type:complete len:1418 (-),score=244.61 TRINITY_DN34200_c0_g1_i1:170-3916(-)